MRAWVTLFAVISAACANSSAGTPESTPLPSGDTPDGGSSGASDGARPPAPGAGGGDSGSGHAPDATTTPSTRTGILLFGTGAPVVGLPYAAGAHAGTTDAAGAFTYDDGASVSFRIGPLDLGSVKGAPVLSPYALAGSVTCDDTDDLKKLVALLASVDADATPGNGIQLPPGAAAGSAGKTLAQTSWPDLAAAATSLGGKPLAAPLDALRAFIGVFDAEAWTSGATDTFGLAQAALRGQGVTTDGASWFFSGTTGLERTDLSFASQASNGLAIPIQLVVAGSDHIGDIDWWGGKLYAPVEDKNYQAPKVVLYDPSSLSSGTIYSVPVALQTKGVPWIAVDGPRGVAYMAEWDPTPAIHVFSLADLSYQKAIDIAPAVGRVQGGKVYKGQLYLTVDDDQKHVYKVHLASGTVQVVHTLGLAGMELEGLAFLARADGSLLHTLNVTADRKGVDFRHHTNTRAPARWAACP